MKVTEIEEKALPILRRRSVKRAGVFGSSARGDALPHDVDMLVEMPRPYGLFAFLSLKKDLEDSLGMKVDLIEYASIKQSLRDRILKDEVRIL